MRVTRVLEIFLGFVFIFSALTKALDLYAFAVQVSYYGVVRDPLLVQIVARGMVGVETLLGACLLAGIRLRGVTLLATAGLLVAFSGLTAYAWAFHGLKDCGCFGKYVQMGPGPSIVKNVVLLAVTAAVWFRGKRPTAPEAGGEPRHSSRPAYLLASCGVGAVLIAALFSAPAPPTVKAADKEMPFAHFEVSDGGRTLSLAKGEYVVAMLSATCDHCQAAAGILNELERVPKVPPIVGLVMGDAQEIQQFRDIAAPEFPVQPIDTLQFFDLIGTEPPRFYVIRDGKEVRHLDALDPSLEDLEAFVLEPSETTALS